MNIGERVGDYQIVEVLGAGGMGQVYKVRNVLSERIEAMKVLLPNMGNDPELADRFLREIKVQAALDHPNIARLHTAQQAGDQLCMIMEFVEGKSLEELLQHGPIGLRDAVSYVSQVLEALAYAHARGVVHRDIKPGNIMLTPTGTVKLMDFGIARMKADRRLTQTGRTVGSLYYMSPEQIKGGEPDPRSDLYSLGVTMYEMVTGRKPFEGTSDYSIMAAHLQQTPAAPIEVVPGVPTDLSEIILMAISKDPATRFQTAEAFRHALANVAGGAPPSPVAQTRIMPPAPHAMPPPVPPPVYSAPPVPSMPPPAPVAKTGSRRGLYMALGSVATLIVLVAAAIEGPKLLRTRAQDAAAKPPEITATPVATPSTDVAPPPAPAAAADTAPVTTPAPAPAAVVEPPKPVTPAVQRPPAQKPPPQAPKAQVQITPAQPVIQAPVQVQQPAVQAPPPQPAPVQTPPPAKPAANAQLNELRQQYNELSIRATTAKNGLRSIQQQMARQGLNMRGDILAADSRVDYQMKEAMDYIRSGDAEQARTAMEMAQRSLDVIEKFLGR